MLSISLISLLVAIPVFSYRITLTLFNRITSVVLIYSALLAFNGLYIESLASGVGIYSGLFHVTTISVAIEGFLLFTGALILLGWGPKNISVVYYNIITMAMSRYTPFIIVIVLSFVMNIIIGSPVYCEDGPAQTIAATVTESKIQSAAQDGSVKVDIGGLNLFDNPSVKKAIVEASNTVADTNTNSILSQCKAFSSVGKGEGRASQVSILIFFANWLKVNNPNLLPSDLQNNLLDYFSSGLSFTGINIIVSVMYAAVCYLLFFFSYTPVTKLY